jgi:hypothetical protein
MAKAFGYVWTVLTNLMVVAVTLAMFTVASSPFQTVVICALVLIYIELRAATTMFARGLTETRFALAGEFIGLAKVLNAETAEEQVAANVKEYEAMTPHYYINVGFRTLLWVIVVWKLVAAMVFA